MRENLSIEVIERNIDRTELYIADEILLCGTYAEIEPVISVDRYSIGSGKPGIITTELKTIYLNLVRGNSDIYPEWLTKV